MDTATTSVRVPDRIPVKRAAKLLPALARFRVAILVYAASRALLMFVAVLNGALRHNAFLPQLAHWDGLWYTILAYDGYPDHLLHARSTLGFFPLYGLVIRSVAAPVHWLYGGSLLARIELAGVLVSTVGGLIATVLVQQLATDWWGERSGRRAAILFCLFPGSVVFSMVYAEGLLIPLAAGCLLAVGRRRWVLAGVLAGLATATEPQGLVLVGACAAAAGLIIRRAGLRAGRRSLWAPALSLSGAAAFAGYLWAHVGTPFASLLAQRYGWHEKTDPFALVHLVRWLGDQISFAHFNHPTIDLNLVAGVFGAAFLVAMLVLLWRAGGSVPAAAWLWTAGLSFLMLTSRYIPPNPRLLITAFPVVMVAGHYLQGRRFVVAAALSGTLLAGMSALTFVGTTLRP